MEQSFFRRHFSGSTNEIFDKILIPYPGSQLLMAAVAVVFACVAVNSAKQKQHQRTVVNR